MPKRGQKLYIRQATPDDIPAIHALVAKVYTEMGPYSTDQLRGWTHAPAQNRSNGSNLIVHIPLCQWEFQGAAHLLLVGNILLHARLAQHRPRSWGPTSLCCNHRCHRHWR